MQNAKMDLRRYVKYFCGDTLFCHIFEGSYVIVFPVRCLKGRISITFLLHSFTPNIHAFFKKHFSSSELFSFLKIFPISRSKSFLNVSYLIHVVSMQAGNPLLGLVSWKKFLIMFLGFWEIALDVSYGFWQCRSSSVSYKKA